MLEKAEQECLADSDCDNRTYCDGTERCVEGHCQGGTSACQPGDMCDELQDVCCPEWMYTLCGAGCGCTPQAPMGGLILVGLIGLRFVPMGRLKGD